MHNHSSQNFWNVASTIDFLLVTGLMMWALVSTGNMPFAISLFDAVLIGLASFRITRLVVRDAIFQFFRDWFLENGKEPEGGWRRTMLDLLGCVWCTGVWVALFVSFAYFMTPLAWFPIFVFAMAGVASFLNVVAARI